jgi:hypothetical protein
VTPYDLSTDRLGARADDVYAALTGACTNLDEAEAAAFMARLVLILANLAGDADAVIAAIETARKA